MLKPSANKHVYNFPAIVPSSSKMWSCHNKKAIQATTKLYNKIFKKVAPTKAITFHTQNKKKY